jgi:two-component system NtrC family sensor kinase
VVDDALMLAQLEVEQVVEKRTAELAQVNQTLREDVTRREQAELALIERNAELHALNAKLSSAQEHLIQSEKLASIGQLAAGVAHEINNPIGYIFSNFGTLEKYLAQLFEMLDKYEQSERTHGNAATVADLVTFKHKIDMEFLKEDIPTLMSESKEGIVRVRKIVQDLKDFSHVDATQEWQYTNLNQGIDSTINVVNSEIKYKADLVKEYGVLPDVQCMGSQINQVVMNLVVNAAHAMGAERGKITIRTGCDGPHVWVEVADTGSGIPKDVLPRIFDPFYTTKPVGKGTGLGLSLSYGIIQKHNGSITVETEIGKGTTFRVVIPVSQPEAHAKASPSA